MISSSIDHLDGQAFDVCIIGAGPIGLSLAMELERSNLKVLILESGGLRRDKSKQELSSAELLNPSVHDDLRIAVSRQLGGTSNLWGGRCQPLNEIDFRTRPYVENSGWPISLEELWPHYKRACYYASCGAPSFYLSAQNFVPGDDEFRWNELERFSNTPSFRRAYKKVLRQSRSIDIRLNATVVGIELRNMQVAEIEIARSNGVRRKISVPRLVIAAGGLETTRLLLSMQRSYPELFGGDEGALGRYYMGHLIGEISDITFTQDEYVRAFSFLNDGSGSYVRRRFIPSDSTQQDNNLLNIAFWPVVPPIADARHGSGILSLIYLLLAFEPLGQLLLPEAIRIRHVASEEETCSHLSNILGDLLGISAFVPSLLWRRYFSPIRLPGLFVHNRDRKYGLSYHAEHSPNRNSRVKLGSVADSLGLSCLEIDLQFSRSDAEAVVRSHELLRQWLLRSGIGSIDYRQPEDKNVAAVLDQACHGTHQLGTARMGLNRKDGVVDRNLQVFDIPNLYVASTAVMPTSGQANPTLTGIALGVRLAKHLSTQIKKGAL